MFPILLFFTVLVSAAWAVTPLTEQVMIQLHESMQVAPNQNLQSAVQKLKVVIASQPELVEQRLQGYRAAVERSELFDQGSSEIVSQARDLRAGESTRTIRGLRTQMEATLQTSAGEARMAAAAQKLVELGA